MEFHSFYYLRQRLQKLFSPNGTWKNEDSKNLIGTSQTKLFSSVLLAQTKRRNEYDSRMSRRGNHVESAEQETCFFTKFLSQYKQKCAFKLLWYEVHCLDE